VNTNAATSLDRLHDIIVPAPVSWWPPAPGWYWVIAFALAFIFIFAGKTFIRWQHNRYRREALAELGRLEALLNDSHQRTAGLQALGELLKRTALSAFSREDVASLTGTKWFAFLDRTGQKTVFSTGLGTLLENAAYDPRIVATLNEQKIQELVAAIRHWIKHHDPNLQQKEAKTEKPNSASLPSAPAASKA